MTETFSLGPSASPARVTDPAGGSQTSTRKPELGHTPGSAPWGASVELIGRSSNVLLICHISPDGDAIGSLLGLGLALQKLGKTPTLACESPVPAKFSFLSGFDAIVNTLHSTSFDLVIGLDSSDLSRLGNVYDSAALSGIPLINIDHHITNLHFGDVNLVDASAASTAELILRLLDQLGLQLDAEPSDSSPSVVAVGSDDDALREAVATCLLTGIVTDTVGFRTSNVTAQVMDAAMRLMKAGASLSHVTHHAFNQRPLSELNLLAQGLNRLHAEDGVAWSEIYLDDRPTCETLEKGDAGLAGMLVRTKEVRMAAVFIESENNQIEVSFRADPGYDVAQLALSLGGGGHPAAAGCTLDGPLEAARERVLPMLRAALQEQSKSQNL
jgi:phosphoesterase RecJ-like protein